MQHADAESRTDCRLSLPPCLPLTMTLKQTNTMKNKSIISLFVFLLGVSVTTTSCEDMLTPDMDRYSQGFTGRDTVNFYFGILGTLQEMVENNVILGEVRADLADTTMYVNDSVSRIAYFENVEDGDNALLNRAAYYKAINQCNFYLAVVDTMAMKYNSYYMRREAAQVEMIRAWVYMQLVQLYGRVPFITQPVDNANTGWETNPADWATPENLKSLLVKAGLNRAYNYEKQYGRPNYGTFQTGAENVTIPHSQTVFSGDLIMAELSLLGAQTQADYMTAATYYYNFLYEQADRRNRYVKEGAAGDLIKYFDRGDYHYSTSAGSWQASFIANYTSNDDVLTLVPSAANERIGRTLTRIQQVYGFNPSSESLVGSSSEEGSISIMADYKNRQLGPSSKFRNLNEDQIMAYIDQRSTSRVEYAEGIKDARYFGSVSNVRTDIGLLPFVQKFGRGASSDMAVYPGYFSFSYSVPLYRIRQVYLRYAEALNRAGFPRHAFAVLRDGLNSEKMPTLQETVNYVPNPENPAEGEGFKEFYTEYREDGCNYIDVDEMRRAAEHPEFLDFSNTIWRNCGVHRMGGSEIADEVERYNYGVTVGQRMLDEAVRTGTLTEEVQAYADKLMAERYVIEEGDEEGDGDETGDGEGEGGEDEGEGDTPGDDVDTSEWPIRETPPVVPEDLELQQNAVETLIADEMALETAFEGHRFFDLTRQAMHKDAVNPGYGTEWFAWMVARRSVNLKPYEDTNIFNPALYNKLKVRDNWYLPAPKY